MTLMAESEEELKSFLMKVKEESEKAGSTFKNLRSRHPVHHFIPNRWGKPRNSDRLYKGLYTQTYGFSSSYV